MPPPDWRWIRLRKHEDELFIKNLENVQGDERDVIFVCYTYGPDPESGRVFQRFGPINAEKGWRRLNVLITRSKKRMVVFQLLSTKRCCRRTGQEAEGSMRTRTSSAMPSREPWNTRESWRGENPIHHSRSPFPDASAGWVWKRFLRLASPDSSSTSVFVPVRVTDLSFSEWSVTEPPITRHGHARDRDRLREEIIKSRGWKIHRIWVNRLVSQPASGRRQAATGNRRSS